jgi:hypothetical protein
MRPNRDAYTEQPAFGLILAGFCCDKLIRTLAIEHSIVDEAELQHEDQAYVHPVWVAHSFRSSTYRRANIGERRAQFRYSH